MSEEQCRHKSVDALISTAIEAWKLTKLFQRVVQKLDSAEQSRYFNQARFSLRRIEHNLAQLELRLVSLEGMPFEAGMAATPLNMADFEGEQALIVDQMLDPIVMGPEGVMKAGTMMLRSA